MREQLNNTPNGRSHEEALALQDEVTRLNADAQQLRQDLNEAVRSGEITGSDLPKALYDVDDAANRANNLRPEAARQVQYASPNGQNAREVAELVVPGFGTLTDAKDIAQLLSTGQYGAAAGMTGLAIASIFPLARAARKVGRTSDAAEDVASAARRVDEVPGTDPAATRDANGVLRTSDGRFATDDSIARSQLNRPSLRGQTKATIEANAPKNPQGQFIDQNGQVITDTHFGHIAGHENRRILSAADELGLSQSQLNDYVNARPQFFKVEDAKRNLSHIDELPGRDNIDHIIIDMEDFFGL